MNQLRPFLQARIAICFTAVTGLLTLSGCRSPSTGCHWLYDYIPEDKTCIAPKEGARRLAWAIFGNDDDGIFGEKIPGYEGTPSVAAAAAWMLRNPLHNFCFYVAGSADRENDEWDLLKITRNGVCVCHYHTVATTVFADEGSSLYLALHGGKPFVSLRLQYLPVRHFDFYLGWRERGNFGIKCLPFAQTAQ